MGHAGVVSDEGGGVVEMIGGDGDVGFVDDGGGLFEALFEGVAMPVAFGGADHPTDVNTVFPKVGDDAFERFDRGALGFSTAAGVDDDAGAIGELRRDQALGG